MSDSRTTSPRAVDTGSRRCGAGGGIPSAAVRDSSASGSSSGEHCGAPTSRRLVPETSGRTALLQSLFDLAKPKQQLPQFDGERHLPLLPSLPHHGQQHVVEVEVDDASRQEFIDPAACVEDRAGDGVDAPLNERLRAIAEDQT